MHINALIAFSFAGLALSRPTFIVLPEPHEGYSLVWNKENNSPDGFNFNWTDSIYPKALQLDDRDEFCNIVATQTVFGKPAHKCDQWWRRIFPCDHKSFTRGFPFNDNPRGPNFQWISTKAPEPITVADCRKTYWPYLEDTNTPWPGMFEMDL